MEGGLGDEAVWGGDADEAGDAGCDAEEEDVPVEACGFLEGEFGALGDEGGDIVVKVEEDGEEEGEGDGYEDVCGGDLPELDEPGAVLGGLKGGRSW